MTNLTKNETKTKKGRIQKFFTDPSLTKQEYKQEADINVIIKRYVSTGEFPINPQPLYADTTQIPDFQTMMNHVIAVEERFDQLPAEVRAKFSNDPSLMLEWAQDPKNNDAAVTMGLIEAKNPDPIVLRTTPPAPTENQKDLTDPPKK